MDSLHLVLPESEKLAIARPGLPTIATSGEKFWIVEDFWQWMRELGLSDSASNLITFLLLCATLVACVWLLDFFLSRVMLPILNRQVQYSKTNLDDILLNRKFFNRLFDLLPVVVIIIGIDLLFAGFTPKLIVAAQLITKSVIIYMVLRLFYSVLDAMNDRYLQQLKKTGGRRKSIKGYLQLTKIILGLLAFILIAATLLRKDPTSLFVGLGAAAAVLSLVFKDTILGFVASIQLSAQDMVRPGDWIEMPSKGADGTVLDININSVKVQNWDNTVTMVPIYSMVSESFINWRGMERSDGRRFVRRFFVDNTSVVFASEALLKRLGKHAVTKESIGETEALARKSSPEALTNLALFRAHLELFLKRHPQVNAKLPIFVRYMADITEKGIGLELYAFSREKAAPEFDVVHRSVVEFVVATAPLFGIRLFQNPSGADFAALLPADRSAQSAEAASEK